MAVCAREVVRGVCDGLTDGRSRRWCEGFGDFDFGDFLLLECRRRIWAGAMLAIENSRLSNEKMRQKRAGRAGNNCNCLVCLLWIEMKEDPKQRFGM